MNVFWVPQKKYFIENNFKLLVVKRGFVSELEINPPRFPSHFVFCGGVVDECIVVWAKPGILKEEYVVFFEHAQLFSKIALNEILSWTFKCIQHALSLSNQHVLPVLETLVCTNEILIDEF